MYNPKSENIGIVGKIKGKYFYFITAFQACSSFKKNWDIKTFTTWECCSSFWQHLKKCFGTEDTKWLNASAGIFVVCAAFGLHCLVKKWMDILQKKSSWRQHASMVNRPYSIEKCVGTSEMQEWKNIKKWKGSFPYYSNFSDLGL